MKALTPSLIQSSYPQALAKLIHLLKSIDLAEEYLQVAVEKALLHWPEKHPKQPSAWLVMTAKNSYIDDYRKQKKHTNLQELNDVYQEYDLEEQALQQSYKDDVLRLIFTSCHPALALDRQILLSLKHVLGLSVEEIAQAMVLTKPNVQQKLLRAKHKITTTKIEYEIPSKKEWPLRLSGVLKTIYLLFNQGYFASEEHNFIRLSLCDEAIRLANLLLTCTNQAPEVAALLSLLLHQDARRPARVDTAGNLVLLPEQNRSLWQQDKIKLADQLIIQPLAKTGRSYYGLQAAIAALHNNAKSYADTDWPQKYQLYLLLIEIDDNPIIQLNAAVALAQTGEFEQAIDKAKRLAEPLKHYQFYSVALAGLYFDSKNYQQAVVNYRKALEKTVNQKQQNFIMQRLTLCNSKLHKKSL